MLPIDNYLRTEQIAEMFGITRVTVHRWINRHGLPAFKRGRIILVHRDQLERWMLRNTENPELQPFRRVS